MMLILQNLEQDMDFTKVTLVPRGLLKSDTTLYSNMTPTKAPVLSQVVVLSF